MPLLGDVRPHRRQIVLARDQHDVRVGQAVVEEAARSPGGRLHPLEPAVGTSPMDWPVRAANAVVRALAAVSIVVPLPKNPRAAMLLAPLASSTTMSSREFPFSLARTQIHPPPSNIAARLISLEQIAHVYLVDNAGQRDEQAHPLEKRPAGFCPQVARLPLVVLGRYFFRCCSHYIPASPANIGPANWQRLFPHPHRER